MKRSLYGRVYLPYTAIKEPQVEELYNLTKTFPQVNLFPILFPTH